MCIVPSALAVARICAEPPACTCSVPVMRAANDACPAAPTVTVPLTFERASRTPLSTLTVLLIGARAVTVAPFVMMSVRVTFSVNVVSSLRVMSGTSNISPF